MPPRHAEDLFSSAYDDTLSYAQQQWFSKHLRECAECRQAFEHFHSSVDALRALPSAHMPIPVHLPSSPPVAVEHPLARLRLRRFLLRPGLATGVAFAAAAVILAVTLTHQSVPLNGTGASKSVAGTALHAGNGNGAAASNCPLSASRASEAPPQGFGQRRTATEAGRPGQQLVLATVSAQAAAGSQVQIYALLTAPQPVAEAPSATLGLTPLTADVPCVAVASTSRIAGFTQPTLGRSQAGAVAQPQSATGNKFAGSSSSPIYTFDVPAGAAMGTVLRITATVPADYPQPGDPSMTVELTLTVT